MEDQVQRKPRILCLHGFRTSAAILKKLVGRWPPTVLDKLDLVFLDGPYPAQGESSVQGFYDPPFFEWFQANQDFSEFYNFEQCLKYVEDYMVKNGPFDGLLGFSQGAVLSSAVPGMQRDGLALTKVPKLKFVVLISGARFGGSKFPGVPKLAATSYSSPIDCPSLHLIGKEDFMKEEGVDLLESFIEPTVICHTKGHTVPPIGGENLDIMLGFIEKTQKICSSQ